MTVLDILDEYKRKNHFFKKETILIGLIISFWLVFMYYLNNWQDTILFFIITISLLILLLKVYDIYTVRINKFDLLIKKIVEEKNEENWSNFKITIKEDKKESKIKTTEATRESSKTHDFDQLVEFEKLTVEDSKKKLEELRKKVSFEFDSEKKVSQELKDRTEERKARMKLFNYKFKESSQYFDFLNYLEKSYYNKQILDDNFFTVFTVYTDYLHNKSPETYQKLIDKNYLESLIVKLQEQQKSTKQENEETN